MKKVVDGLVYDTEKAELIHEWNNHYPCNDFRAFSERLYKTKNGRFFLHGRGGAMSSYRSSYGDSYGSGEEIMPMTDSEVVEWLSAHDGVAIILETFPESVEEA